MSAHSHCGPSGYDRWGVCTASPNAILVARQKGVIDTNQSSKYADEGNVAHALLAICVDLRMSPREFIGESIYVEQFDKQCEVDAEMGEETDKAYEYIMDFITKGAIVWVEQKFQLDKTLPGEKGTADIVILVVENGELILRVMDFKYGRGIIVLVANNSQIKLYALGALDNLLTYEQRLKLKKIVLHVVQPRMNNIDGWSMKKGELELFRVEAHGRHAETKDPLIRKFVPGTHCRFCDVQNRCTTLKKSAFKLSLEDEENPSFDSFKNPETMSDDDLAELWPMLEFLGAWTSNVKKYMTEQAQRGREFMGLKLIAGKKGNRAWKDNTKADVFMKKKGLDDDQCYEKVILTVAKAEKLIGRKKLDKEEFSALFTQSEGGSSLAKADDPRPTYQQVLADEFDD